MNNKSEELELSSVDTKSKPGWVICTFIDGTKKKWKVSDPEFLNMEFKLVPTKPDA